MTLFQTLPVGARPRGFLLHEHLGEHVLDRLEAADRSPELLAILRVVVGELQRALGQAELDAGNDRRALETQARGGVRIPELFARREQGHVVDRSERVEGHVDGLRFAARWIDAIEAVAGPRLVSMLAA